jgi:hypothetical protein
LEQPRLPHTGYFVSSARRSAAGIVRFGDVTVEISVPSRTSTLESGIDSMAQADIRSFSACACNSRASALSSGSADNSAASSQGSTPSLASAERTLSGISLLSAPIGA